MYILGIANKPGTFKATKDSPLEFAREHKDLSKANPGALIFSLFLPEIEKVWACGILGKMDTFVCFTTEGEMTTQRDKYARFYSPREVYILELTPSSKPANGSRPAA